MSSLITTPEYLSKDKLKTELKNYGIRFNQNENKQYYVNLYRKRIMDTEQSRQEFSSDEELIRPAKQGKKQQVQKRKKTIKMDTYLPGVLSLADAELKEELESFGKDLGPIVDSTRDLYQKMLAKLMAENAVGKSGVPQSVQPRDSTEDDDNEEVDHSESFVGEWSSGDSEEEVEVVEERPPPTPTSLKSPSQTKRREGVRERLKRTPANKEGVEEPPPPAKPRGRSHRPTAPQSTSFQGFMVLLLMFAVAFFSYEHYTSNEEDLSLVTKGWRKAGCLWNQVKDYVVKSTPATKPPTTPPPENETPTTPPPENEPPITPPPEKATDATPSTTTPPKKETPTDATPSTTTPPAEQPTQQAKASPPPEKPAAKKKPATKKASTAKTGPK